MKKILAFSLIPLITLAGCAKYDKPTNSDYFCERITHKLHTLPHRYRATGANKRVATEQAKLEKEYYRYDCELYQARKKTAKPSVYVGGGMGIGVN